MKNKIVYKKNIETEQKENAKLDLSVLKKKSSAKTSSGLVLGYLKKLKNANAPFEYLKVLESLYKDIKGLEVSEEVKFDSWRGKSGVHFLVKPDFVIAVRYRKADKFEKPKKVKLKITKDEINKVIWAINKLDEGNEIPTSEIAEKVYGKKWNLVFSTRKQHIKIVEIFNYLEYINSVHYSRRGSIMVLKPPIEIQSKL